MLTDDRGNKTTVKAASWRAGGVTSAKDAALDEPMIMELGRWRSNAWTHYLLYSKLDLCTASKRMSSAAQSIVSASSSLRVRVGRDSGPGPCTDAADAAFAASLDVHVVSQQKAVPVRKVRDLLQGMVPASRGRRRS